MVHGHREPALAKPLLTTLAGILVLWSYPVPEGPTAGSLPLSYGKMVKIYVFIELWLQKVPDQV